MGCGVSCTHGAAGSVLLPQLGLHSWNEDERHSQVGRYPVFALEKGWKETLVTWIDFSVFSLFWPHSLEFFSFSWHNVLTRQHVALINTILAFNDKCNWLFTSIGTDTLIVMTKRHRDYLFHGPPL